MQCNLATYYALNINEAKLKLHMVLRFAKVMKGADTAQANAAAYFRSIEPLVSNISSTATTEIKSAINFGGVPVSNAVEKIQTALAPVYAAYGISRDDMGIFATPLPAPVPATISMAGAKASQSSIDGRHTAALAIDSNTATYAATKAFVQALVEC